MLSIWFSFYWAGNNIKARTIQKNLTYPVIKSGTSQTIWEINLLTKYTKSTKPIRGSKSCWALLLPRSRIKETRLPRKIQNVPAFLLHKTALWMSRTTWFKSWNMSYRYRYIFFKGTFASWHKFNRNTCQYLAFVTVSSRRSYSVQLSFLKQSHKKWCFWGLRNTKT